MGNQVDSWLNQATGFDRGLEIGHSSDPGMIPRAAYLSLESADGTEQPWQSTTALAFARSGKQEMTGLALHQS